MADIGSLVIKLAAETADFREDLGKSALLLERHAESMRGSLEKVAEVAKTTFAIAIGVESVGALKELVMHTLETVAALQDLAEQTGASATALSGFAPVATISGVAMEQIGVGLTKLSKGLAGVDDETKGASQALQYLGIKAKDAGGNLRDPAEVMNDIALKLSNFEDGAGKTHFTGVPAPAGAMRPSVICAVLGFTSGGIAPCRKCAPTIRPRTRAGSRKRTSALAGCTLTSTPAGSSSRNSTYAGWRPWNSTSWYAIFTACAMLRSRTERPLTYRYCWSALARE